MRKSRKCGFLPDSRSVLTVFAGSSQSTQTPLPGWHQATRPAGFDGDKDVAGAGPLILVVLFGRCSGLRGQVAAGLAQQLLAFLVQTDHRIVGASIQIDQLVHAPAVLGGELANAPHQLAPGIEEVFFRIRRMVSRLMPFSGPWRRAASVSSATVQRRQLGCWTIFWSQYSVRVSPMRLICALIRRLAIAEPVFNSESGPVHD